MIKKIAVLILMVMMMMPFASVQAQDDVMHFCGDLSDADCSLLTNSGAAMEDLQSLMFTLQLDLGMDSTNPQVGNLSASLSGGGNLAMKFADFKQMQELAMTDMEAYMKQVPQMLSQLVSDINGNASFLLTLPKELGIPSGSDLTIDLLMKDGVIYLDAGPFMKLSGQGNGEPMWIGMDLGAFYGEAFADIMGNMDMSGMMDSSGWLSTFTNPEFMKDFVQIQRVDDTDLMGEKVAVFEMNLDYGALLSSPAMQSYFSELYQGMGVSQSELDSIMGMLNTMFADSQFKFNEYIGLDDNMLHRFTIDIAVNLDGETMGSAELGKTALTMTMDLNLSNFNEPVEVEIPASATVLPMSMFTGQTGA